jgi:hypothetical protein
MTAVAPTHLSTVVRAPGAHAREAAPILPKAIAARINRFAHQSGQQYASALRDALLRDLRQAVENGTPRDELVGALTDIEAEICPASISIQILRSKRNA